MGGDGIRISEKSKVPYQFGSTRVRELPLPENWASHSLKPRLVELAREVDRLAQLSSSLQAAQVLERCLASGEDLAAAWAQALADRRAARSRSILLQEEIDFVCYAMYGLVSTPDVLSDPSTWDVLIEAGCRPFCILSQKNVEGFEVPELIPSQWPDEMRTVWASRMQAIKNSPTLRVIEDPHYKRRWIGRQGLFNHGAKADEFTGALRNWMLARLEASFSCPANVSQPPQLTSMSRMADAVSHDAEFLRVATAYAGHADFDLQQLVAELVASEAVPALPVQRYTES